jgi:hypothetical protein
MCVAKVQNSGASMTTIEHGPAGSVSAPITAIEHEV